ncbi:hypothetical protein LINPERPRIM_LOCUS42941 [Linum perenne]
MLLVRRPQREASSRLLPRWSFPSP